MFDPLLKKNPNAELIVGASSFKKFKDSNSVASRPYGENEYYLLSQAVLWMERGRAFCIAQAWVGVGGKGCGE